MTAACFVSWLIFHEYALLSLLTLFVKLPVQRYLKANESHLLGVFRSFCDLLCIFVFAKFLVGKILVKIAFQSFCIPEAYKLCWPVTCELSSQRIFCYDNTLGMNRLVVREVKSKWRSVVQNDRNFLISSVFWVSWPSGKRLGALFLLYI